MAYLYRKEGNHEAALSCHEAALRALGDHLKYLYGTNLLLHMVEECVCLRRKDLARRYALEALEMEKVRIGRFYDPAYALNFTLPLQVPTSSCSSSFIRNSVVLLTDYAFVLQRVYSSVHLDAMLQKFSTVIEVQSFNARE